MTVNMNPWNGTAQPHVHTSKFYQAIYLGVAMLLKGCSFQCPLEKQIWLRLNLDLEDRCFTVSWPWNGRLGDPLDSSVLWLVGTQCCSGIPAGTVVWENFVVRYFRRTREQRKLTHESLLTIIKTTIIYGTKVTCAFVHSTQK